MDKVLKSAGKTRKIVSDIEHLRKLFIMPDSPDKFVEFGTELLDLIHDFFKKEGGIHSSISLADLAKLFSDINIPREAHLLKDVLQEIKTKIIAHSVKVASPYYIGHMTSAVPYVMILLEMIIAALNQNQVKIESAKASTFVEREFVSWMHRLIYNRSESYYKKNIQNRNVAFGNITQDGTLANMTALLVARNKAFPSEGAFRGVREMGMAGALKHYGYDRAVIIVSRRGHYSIEKVARILGIGGSNVIKIPVDYGNRVDINALREVCRGIEKNNKSGSERVKIIAVVGIAGNTETGNIDNLHEISKITARHKIFFHVDAAWGGSVMLVDRYSYLFNGICKADSVSFDAHKLLYSPVSTGIVLFKSEKDLLNIYHSANYILREDSVDLGRFTIEGSRPFSCLKPWATLKIFGTEGFRLLFERAFELSAVLRGLVERHCNFEPMNNPELFIFNYRFVPKVVQMRLSSLMIELRDKTAAPTLDELSKIEKINERLNALNIELHRELRAEDNSFVSRTMIDAPQYYSQNIVILRAITINPLTTDEILNEIIEEQNRLGNRIYKNQFKNELEAI